MSNVVPEVAKLEAFFRENPSVALGFSGGVDSSYLLYTALRCGANIKAYFVKSAFQPDFELRDAQRLIDQLGAKMTVLELDVFENSAAIANPPDRCYHCKKVIFGTLCDQAKRDDADLIIDGTNASDDVQDRPGMKALGELSVRSPLRECGLTKAQIRQLSKEAGLFTWDKPAYACLATRIPTGREITPDLVRRVEAAEDALFGLGFTDFRVRVMGEAARIQLPHDQMGNLIAQRDEVLSAVEPLFSPVLLDIKGR